MRKTFTEPTLCWTCKNAYGGCPWTEQDPVTKKTRFAPVPGWTATKTHYTEHYQNQTRIGHSYHVISCPLYLAEQNEADEG